MCVIDQLKAFLEGCVLNQWLKDDDLTVYTRKGHHILDNDDKIEETLDVATIEVNARKRGQGIWTQFIKEVHELNPYAATYVENVHNPTLAAWLECNNWEPALLDHCYLMRT